jgi:hypothetical protein
MFSYALYFVVKKKKGVLQREKTICSWIQTLYTVGKILEKAKLQSSQPDIRASQSYFVRQ